MFSNPPVETLHKPREAQAQHRFSNPVIPSNATHGVEPNLGFVPFHPQKHLLSHPDLTPAIHAIINEWGHRSPRWTDPAGVAFRKEDFPDNTKPLSPPDTFYLYSYNTIKAIATNIGENKQPQLRIPVDRSQPKEDDLNWSFFENLLLSKIAFLAGKQERLADQSANYLEPSFCYALSSAEYSPQAINVLSAKWQGDETLIYITRNSNGEPITLVHGSFDLYDGVDRQLRLNITQAERILSINGQEIARVITRYQGTDIGPNSQTITDETIPLPVFSVPEVVVSGTSKLSLQKHLNLIKNLLDSYATEDEKMQSGINSATDLVVVN